MYLMHRIRIELTRRALMVRVELAPEESARAITTQGVIANDDRPALPGLAKTRPILSLSRKSVR